MGTLLYLICIAVASFVVLAQAAVAQGTNTTLPLTYPAQVLQGDGSQTCPSKAQEEGVRNEVDNATLRLLRKSVVPLLQNFSCGRSGWRRVAYLNMSDPSQQCPSVWREITTPHRVCGRRSTSGASCEGLTYTTGSEQYDQVCGRIIGYQIGSPTSFRGSSLSINYIYVDGISVTHGSSQHIWTFAAGFQSEQTRFINATCPCITGSTNGNRIPSFVGQNYFCETGITWWNGTHGVLWPDGDPVGSLKGPKPVAFR